MIRFRLLGSLELSRDDGTEVASVLAQPKRLALLAYLATSPSAYHRRDRLLAMFWPEQDDARARESLNTAIRFLRRELGRSVIVSRGIDEIGLNAEMCWCDTVAFRAALEGQLFADASALYRGDFLDGFYVSNAAPFEEWMERTRSQLRSDAARATRLVAEERERSRHYTTAVSAARRALELSGEDERVLRQLLELLERLGDRAGALFAYDSFERRLAEEYSAEPSGETRALIARIRSRSEMVSDSTKTSGTAISPAVSLPWVIEREIGRGGMAIVYLARDTAHDRPVALKVLRSDRLSPGAEYFLREIRITARLAHPRILPLIDSGVREGAPYLVTPFVDGESLRDRLTRTGPLRQQDAVQIAIGIAEALDYAHRAGVVHCDIKPENVLLTDGQVVVADFGVARAIGLTIDSSAVAGSREYMSPEQRAPNSELDARSDLYSLGCVLAELLAGEVPRDGRHATELLERCASSGRLRALVLDCLSIDRTQRPASASVVLDRLRQAGGEMDAAKRTELNRPSARRKAIRRVVGSAAIMSGALLASAMWFRSANTLIGRGRLTPNDTIVLADFQVTGPDSSSSAALTSILRRDFQDSKAVSLMAAGDVRSALKRMKLSPTSPVTAELAMEIAQREDRRAVLVPTVVPFSSAHLITLRLIESATGNELAIATGTASDVQRELLPALAETSEALRHTIGESRGRAKALPSRPRRLLTTSSLQAARLMWSQPSTVTDDEKLAKAREAVRIDSAFAYAWMSIGNMLSWTNYRSATLDSAFTMANRFRGNLTLMEGAQVGGLYLRNVQRDRRAALRELDAAVRRDTTIWSAVPLNMTQIMVESRQFEASEKFARRIERWRTVGSAATADLIRSQLGQGKYGEAESTLAVRRSTHPGDRANLGLELLIRLSTVQLDSAESLLARLPNTGLFMRNRSSLYRLRGRPDEAHRMDAWLDSSAAASAEAAGARFDSTSGRALTAAREALWLAGDTAAALAALDRRWRSDSRAIDVQERIDGMIAAGLYAAVGKPAIARAIVTRVERGADSIAKRGFHEYREAAFGEIALAEGKFADALRHFRASDLAADGLPASECAVCVLPHLARVADRAGWSDSARVFWEDYVNRPSNSRLASDQWFLAMAYGRLIALGSKRGDSATIAYRDALARLRQRTTPGSPTRR